MSATLIRNIQLVNEGTIQTVDLLIREDKIAKIASTIDPGKLRVQEIDGAGKHLLPGCIDDQVHFREPGLTHKACIATESKAAVAGGVTSFMEMPNTIPNALTQELLEEKYRLAAIHSLANYSFYMGCSNENTDEVLRTNERKKDICGIKVFMGSSTGNMLVDNPNTLDRLFKNAELLIATHCEDESIIRENLEKRKQDPRPLSASDHARIRDVNGCYASSLYAIQIAKQYDTRLHVLHISTAKELSLFSNLLPLKEKRITNEVCVHHLHFTAEDYARLGNQIKCNPSIKAAENKQALWEALLDDRLDLIATDHAPHTWEEKNVDYEKAPAGLPLVQHSLLLMLQEHQLGKISLERIVQKMSHAVADCFQIPNRGYIREGYQADLVMIDLHHKTLVDKQGLYYRCGWSPLEGMEFSARIERTFVNGRSVYGIDGWDESVKGMRLAFDR